MATQQTCDKCGQPAITTAKFETSTTTPIKFDLCQDHIAEIKKLMRVFSGQDIGEIEFKEDAIVGEGVAIKG